MTPYETLGLAPDATPEQIKKAHRRRASETHPDMGGDREEFQRVQAAYELLSDPDRRARFDATGDDGRDDVPPAEVIAKRAFTDSLTDEHRKASMDYLQHAIAILRRKRSDTVKAVRDTEEDIAQLQHTRQHLVRTRGERPVLEEVLDALLAPRIAALPKLRTWLPRFEEAIEILKGYRFALPTALAWSGEVNGEWCL